MIDKKIEDFLLKQSDTFVKSADSVAVLNEEHKIAHAKLLLSQYKYSRVPVLNKEREYIGVLGLNEIVEFEMSHDFFYEKSENTAISEIVNTNVPTVQRSFGLEEVLHLLVKEPFIPVLKGKKFDGIIARQEILKAFNAFAHDFTKYYDITKRN
ncbi:cyclic-di-AMP-binding protein CbpB [Lactococcus nasutitermitis]|uniref:Cyclic-di-AMP-binding protein CbpB n=1 Tax=Lactococcus nasutitermitis TaxID=1652957 RepID=A0ABV9JDP6_9LACT|nr:cyclic-di-AMP-binding protein CbpB [Lactococcus nasutitermitis]